MPTHRRRGPDDRCRATDAYRALPVRTIMGAGASTATPPPPKGKGKRRKPPKAPDPKAVLAKAAESGRTRRRCLPLSTADGDSKLSKAELQEAVKKAKAVENWPDPLIEQVIAFFGSGDDVLSLEQFTEALAELKSARWQAIRRRGAKGEGQGKSGRDGRVEAAREEGR